MAGSTALRAQIGLVSFLVAVACGGSSIRHDDGDESDDDGLGIPSAGGSGGRGNPDGTGGSSVDPFLCLELERALDRARECVADADCGRIIESWTCGPATLSEVTPKPPVVNLGADVRDVELLFAEASKAGGCRIVTNACDYCVVNGFGCLSGRCGWHIADCGPPPS